jgi:hypothetical protein
MSRSFDAPPSVLFCGPRSSFLVSLRVDGPFGACIHPLENEHQRIRQSRI